MAGKVYEIENAKLRFKNFGGRPDNMNPAGGKRSFCLLLEDERLVDELLEEGYNIKYLRPRDEDDAPTPYIQVKVAYGDYPPKIYMIAGNKKTLLDEENVEELDMAELENVDLTFSPYHWNVGGKSGVTAYCKSLYATIVQDRFASKYDDME